MRKKKFSILSKDGRTTVRGIQWQPEGDMRGILQIVHGMVEFADRYDRFAQYLAEEGFLVVAHDQIGHGDSVISQKEWGYFAPEHPSDVLVKDIHQIRKSIQHTYPGVPYFILGHSMGSYLVRKYISKHGKGLSGAVIMGTGYVSMSSVKFGKLVCRGLAKIFGWHHRSRLMEVLTFSGPYWKYDLWGKDPERSWLTRDVEVVNWYHNEPKCNFNFTMNGYMGLLETVEYDQKIENIQKTPDNLPLLIISGQEDPVGNFGKGIHHVEQLYRRTGIKNLSCILYKDYRHEILNEINYEKVQKDIALWMVRRL